jgi:hypothetical protein
MQVPADRQPLHMHYIATCDTVAKPSPTKTRPTTYPQTPPPVASKSHQLQNHLHSTTPESKSRDPSPRAHTFAFSCTTFHYVPQSPQLRVPHFARIADACSIGSTNALQLLDLLLDPFTVYPAQSFPIALANLRNATLVTDLGPDRRGVWRAVRTIH